MPSGYTEGVASGDESLLLLKALEGTNSSLENALGFSIAWIKLFAQIL